MRAQRYCMLLQCISVLTRFSLCVNGHCTTGNIYCAKMQLEALLLFCSCSTWIIGNDFYLCTDMTDFTVSHSLSITFGANSRKCHDNSRLKLSPLLHLFYLVRFEVLDVYNYALVLFKHFLQDPVCYRGNQFVVDCLSVWLKVQINRLSVIVQCGWNPFLKCFQASKMSGNKVKAYIL